MLLIPNTNAFTVEIMDITVPLITMCPVLFAVFWPVFFNKRDSNAVARLINQS